MSRQSVAFVALLSVAVSLVSAQDIIFPGETDRPSRFPLRPTTPLPTPPTQPTPGRGEATTQTPFVPSVTAPNTQAYFQCITDCRSTSEYNPVCATDGVVYYNPGKLGCAKGCGNPVEMVRYGQCDTSNTRG